MPALNRLSRSPILLSFDVLPDIVDRNVGWNISKELLEGRLLMLAVSELLECSRSSKALFDRDLEYNKYQQKIALKRDGEFKKKEFRDE